MVLEQFEPTESKYQKRSTISRWKGETETASSFFQVRQWLANGWIIGQCCFYHLPLKEWMALSIQRREKGSKTKSSGPCPNIVKLYNSGMGGVDLMDQIRFYLRIFFNLMDIACVNKYLIHNMKHPNKLSLLDYKIVVAKNLNQYHHGRKRAVPMLRQSKWRTNQNRLMIMEDIYQITKRCKNAVGTVQWNVRKIEHSSSVWLATFHYA